MSNYRSKQDLEDEIIELHDKISSLRSNESYFKRKIDHLTEINLLLKESNNRLEMTLAKIREENSTELSR